MPQATHELRSFAMKKLRISVLICLAALFSVIAQVPVRAAPERLRHYDSGYSAGVASANMSQPMNDFAA
jgi:hypothetical protein